MTNEKIDIPWYAPKPPVLPEPVGVQAADALVSRLGPTYLFPILLVVAFLLIQILVASILLLAVVGELACSSDSISGCGYISELIFVAGSLGAFSSTVTKVFFALLVLCLICLICLSETGVIRKQERWLSLQDEDELARLCNSCPSLDEYRGKVILMRRRFLRSELEMARMFVMDMDQYERAIAIHRRLYSLPASSLDRHQAEGVPFTYLNSR
ncbi:hypothetical protein [Chitinimonas koreensis]|uniref:hypothetical protein n=1 Tax=Chitinimonas koreensis TaxID=356302 RepID=UPI00048CEF49|nr:hypothetical protein [Chitinimonas koreensis]QNM95468.1 hypothetical protein H9L41_16570 [Chitinimonas koreensis]